MDKKRTYICAVVSNSTYEREYEVETKSAMKCAMRLGRAEGGEIVRVCTKGGKCLSEVRWSPECGYYRCTPDGWYIGR